MFLEIVHQELGVVEKFLLVRGWLCRVEAIALGGKKARRGERLGMGVELGVDGLDDKTRRSAVEVILATNEAIAGLDSPVEVAHLLAAKINRQARAAA